MTTTANLTDPSTPRDYAAKATSDALNGAAHSLRALADRLENSARTLGEVPRPGAATYGNVVAQAQHDVSWTIANLRMEETTRNASEADIARVQEA